MSFIKLRFALFLFIILFAASCSPSKKLSTSLTPENIQGLHFLGEYDIPNNLDYNHTTVGGLSGIDYDANDHLYYLISDDRSAINPARFYTAKIFFTQKGIDNVQFMDVKNLLQANGDVYPNNKQDPYHTPDPEAIRYNPLTHQLVWSSEGERIVTGKDTILENPAVTLISKNGNYIDSFPLPANLIMHATEKGPRQNSVLEGLGFADHYKTLIVSLEEPLYEDGPRADTTDNNAYTRLFKFDMAGKRNIAQFAYKLDPVAHSAMPADAFKINGIPDILSFGNDQLLVIERSFSTGFPGCTIKVFIAGLKGASDITRIPSLKVPAHFIPITKKLLLNMDELGIYIDNIEGMTWGPLLSNGHRTILFIADNNFSAFEKSQLLLFEVIE